MNPLDKETSISSKVQLDLIERSKQGIWIHPLCMILILLTTGLAHQLPCLALFFTVSVVLLALLRTTTRYTRFPRRICGEALLRHLDLDLMFSCSAVWGIVSGIALWKLGYQDKDVLILLLYHGVVIIGTVHLMVHDRALIFVALALLFGPPTVGSLLHGGPGPLHYLAVAIPYLLYCIVQGKKLNQLYASQISDNYDLSVAAYQDCLTGLPNRLYMNHAMETCIDDARNRGLQIALLYIDLDGFKQINDRYSHKVGDLFLREAASRIRQSLREHDVAARIGGDEFNILLPGCVSEAEAIAVATRVLADARLPVNVNGHQLNYSASIGVSLLPRTADNLDMLVRTADEAMYAAKSLGKDRICMQLPGGNKHIVTEIRAPAIFAMAV